MPHTSRKQHKKPAKRIEVVDDEGWTRVTTSKAQRAPRPGPNSHTIDGSAQRPFVTTPEPGATIGKIKARYDEIEQQWLASDSCKILSTLLRDQVPGQGLQVDKCIVFGTGSFCGLRNGWILRDTPSLCQLAVFRTMQQVVAETSGSQAVACAQDPAYNGLDIDFLETLGIEVMDTPVGFESLSEKSLAYTPCAELDVELRVLERQPAIVLTGKLDWTWRNDKGQACSSRLSRDTDRSTPSASERDSSNQSRPQPGPKALQRTFDLESECRIVEKFTESREEMRIPDFRDAVFRNQHLYWSSTPEASAQDGSENDVVK